MNIKIICLVPGERDVSNLSWMEPEPVRKTLAECLCVDEVPVKGDSFTLEGHNGKFIVDHREWALRDTSADHMPRVWNTVSRHEEPWIDCTLIVSKK